MHTKWFNLIPGMALAIMLTLLVRGTGAQDRQQLAGTWTVTLKFPVCSTECPCPGGMPNIPIPALHRYLVNWPLRKDGSMLEVGNSLRRSTGLGSWVRMDDNQFMARFAFFPADGGREDVTMHITLASAIKFTSSDSFDLFDATGNRISPVNGCPREETATRFD
jgi:hypothetical protein